MNLRALVLCGNGTNCEVETAHAVRTAGADEVKILSVWELLAGHDTIDAYDFLCLPGGFLDGDHLGSARAGAFRFAHGKPGAGRDPIRIQLDRFLDAGGVIIGICNGFQLLVKLGLLPSRTWEPRVTLTHNLNGRFEDRWVTLIADPESPCVFTSGLQTLDLPIRHGEGRLVAANDALLKTILKDHLAPLKYVDPATGLPTEVYPLNPNGSPGGIAALCDPTGRIFGLMPHPEAFSHYTNHPRWTREFLDGAPENQEGTGILLFRNAVDWLRRNHG
ncbi:phosphoribosylformylglycinamidine synthase subunit PurQ [Myxococcota bacterium]|nr:phosphoribosylformylglycinamidine synthase subunit PurQ [Myxococcota bacterium]MBU1410842.1 phosphoribosylformylglycinamidine synthase subunit PurQ [Myxococcota bacterium]MBU1509275.1 phosphoribosylformylglycinamidine synthase subunit PurQ [Myxococcota bacterium]